MTRWIALLRGVNVGGNRRLPMADFRATLTSLGFVDVATYIQSGNAVFTSSDTPARLAERIERAVRGAFGFTTDVLVLTEDTMADVLEANPYPEAIDDPAKLYLYFPFGEIGEIDGGEMAALASPDERFSIVNNVLYFHAPGGVGRSKLASKLGHFIATPMTARNLRSCGKVLDLARRTGTG